MKTPQWIKKLGGHAGELYVAAELSKRGIPNALLPENFSDDDILVGGKDGSVICFIQVKACHPDRSSTFILQAKNEEWQTAPLNQFVVFVWLGSPRRNESPRYWVAPKREVGAECAAHSAHGTHNWERRFGPAKFPAAWRDNWPIIEALVAAVPNSALQPTAGARRSSKKRQLRAGRG
jgi:hypothetical protein